MTIVNDDSRVINKLDALLTDDTRAVIYDRLKRCLKVSYRQMLEILNFY